VSRGWECIAPAAAGGGWDLTCRATARAAAELGLSPGTMRVTNIPGAGGGIAFAHAVAQRDRDSGVLIAASPATTLRLAQGQFAHLTEDDVRWVAAIGADYGVLAVAPDAPWQTLEELLQEWRPDPSRFVVSGGSAVAGLDHMKMLVLGEAAGVDPLRIRYVPFDGGGEALTALLGGFVDILSTDASQVVPHVEAGTLRVLAILAPERSRGVLAAIPTAREAGYAVDWITWRGFYVPKGIPDESYARWIEVLTEVEQSEAWARVRESSGLDPLFLAGAEFEAFVQAQVEEYREMSREIGLIR
jgi:putative tricarboxylic transport membrane protein